MLQRLALFVQTGMFFALKFNDFSGLALFRL